MPPLPQLFGLHAACQCRLNGTCASFQSNVGQMSSLCGHVSGVLAWLRPTAAGVPPPKQTSLRCVSVGTSQYRREKHQGFSINEAQQKCYLFQSLLVYRFLLSRETNMRLLFKLKMEALYESKPKHWNYMLVC